MKDTGSEILVGTNGDRVCVKVEGKGTHLNSQSLREFLFGMMEGGYRDFHVDLGNCTYMDSTFLGMLVGVCLRLKNVSSDKITIEQIGPRNLELLKTLGIDQFFRMESNTAGPDGSGTGLQSLPESQPSTEEKAAVMLEAHETLANVDERNVCRFKDVITYLKEDLARIKTARSHFPPQSKPQ